MNVYDLLNSRSIAEYWKEIGYVPDSVEAAWIVYSNRSLTFSQKLNLWREITDTMPDMEIKRRPNCPHFDSLHGFITRYIEINKRFLNWFYDNTDCVYVLKDTDDDWQYETVFSSMDKIREFIGSEDVCEAETYKISKLSIDSFCKYPACITVNSKAEPMLYDFWAYGDFPMSEEEDNLLYAFEGMWFNFPVPFRKGDVVYNPYYRCNMFGSSDVEKEKDLFVVIAAGVDRMSEKVRKWFLEGRSGDGSDMNFCGYAQSEDGRLYTEVFGNYMDFELYKGELKGRHRLIKLISNYLKGLLGEEILIMAYHQILSEIRAKRDISCLFAPESLELAGVNVDKK